MNLKWDTSDALVLVGCSLVWYGIYLVFHPAAYILTGSLITYIGYSRARKGGEKI